MKGLKKAQSQICKMGDDKGTLQLTSQNIKQHKKQLQTTVC